MSELLELRVHLVSGCKCTTTLRCPKEVLHVVNAGIVYLLRGNVQV